MPQLKVAITLGGEIFEVEGDLAIAEVRPLFREFVNAQAGFDVDRPTLEDLSDTLAAATGRLKAAVAAVST